MPKNQSPTELHGEIFSGEAPESDDEILAFSNVKLKIAQEVTEVYQPSPTKSSSCENTVLQQCLSNFSKIIYVKTAFLKIYILF